MRGDRHQRLLALLSAGPGAFGTLRLCQVCAEVTATTGAGLMLMSADVPQGSLCTTDRLSALVEELQYSLGEGPCVDAYHHDRPILEADLAHPAEVRWPAFAGPALQAGVRAVFGFPLHVGAVRLGALNLCRDRRGPLDDDQHADALALADLAARSVLMWQADAPAGEVAAELEVGADLHYAVHQAAGMVAAQLGVSVGQAMIRLRAHAFGNERTLADVADEVVARTLRFDVAGS